MMDKEIYQKIDEFIEGLADKKDDLKILQFIQNEVGYIPEELQEYVAEKTNLFIFSIQNTINFYPSLKTEKSEAIEIKVCTGRACSGNGSKFTLEEVEKELGISVGETTLDGKYKLLTQNCFGKCPHGPNIYVGDKWYKGVKASDAKALVEWITEE